MPSTDGLTTYRYSVLNFAPTAISDAIAPCLVLAEARSIEKVTLRLFVSRRWKQNLPESDREYVAAFMEHVVSLPQKEIEQLLVNVDGISVGPLRPGAGGICDELELTRLLNEVFGEIGYDVLDSTK